MAITKVKIKYLKKFGDIKKGDTAEVSPSLASRLVGVRKVAEYVKGTKPVDLTAERKKALEAETKERILTAKTSEYLAELEEAILAEIQSEKATELKKEIKRRAFAQLQKEIEEEGALD